jgi:hypothetical protein
MINCSLKLDDEATILHNRCHYLRLVGVWYSKTCLKRNAMVPVIFFFVFTGLRFTKGCVLIKQSTKNMIA